MNLQQVIHQAFEESPIVGIRNLSDHCGLSHTRTANVLAADPKCKIGDVHQVLNSLGYQIKYVKK